MNIWVCGVVRAGAIATFDVSNVWLSIKVRARDGPDDFGPPVEGEAAKGFLFWGGLAAAVGGLVAAGVFAGANAAAIALGELAADDCGADRAAAKALLDPEDAPPPTPAPLSGHGWHARGLLILTRFHDTLQLVRWTPPPRPPPPPQPS